MSDPLARLRRARSSDTLAGAAGVMTGLVYQNINPYMGFGAGLKACTAAVVGGIGNIQGAMLGGMVIGVAEQM